MSPVSANESPSSSVRGYGSTASKARGDGKRASVKVHDVDNDSSSGGSNAEVAAARPITPIGSLQRGLSARQVQMIAIAGTIGTGLFLGTGKSLAQGGPASVLICYTIVGYVVYVTVQLLGEMATQYPVAGSFTAYAARFFSPSYAFALSWNYWFNDAVSVASDLTAAQLVLAYWTESHLWIISLVFLVFLLGVNSIHVRAYGEMEYLLSSLKIATIIIFIIVGVFVNLGANRDHEFIGFKNWSIPGAPFVGGFGGFARVFVTASFAYGGTESLGITAGETRNPTKNMPRVVRFVFWRILIFYIVSLLIIGMNVPYNYPNLSNHSTTTSPFTIVFYQAGSNIAASFVNTVILSSALSAGNHALYAGTRLLYSLSTTTPPLAPRMFSRTTRNGVPIAALLATSSMTGLCFATSYIGSGVLWGWLQNIVGVSNQIAWLSIGLASWRFRKAWIRQGRSMDEMKFHASWTWPWGPAFVIITVSLLILIQGWSSFVPIFDPIDFISFYLEIPLMVAMYLSWAIFRRHRHRRAVQNNRSTHSTAASDSDPLLGTTEASARVPAGSKRFRYAIGDLVDVNVVDLFTDEYEDQEDDREEEKERERRLGGKWRTLWKAWYWLA